MSSGGPTASDLLTLFAATFAAKRRPGQPVVGEPGVSGTLGSAEDPYALLLVTDDRAERFLAALEGPAIAIVLDAAPRCAGLLAGWGETTPIALMVRPELETLPDLPLDLQVRDDVPLEDMVRLVDEPDVVLGLLGRSPARFFAAVDDAGVVRATSASAVYGEHASVLFVNTEPAWRGRGIGTAMTALALRDARERGARRACLTSTAEGQGIYARLGFSVAAFAVDCFRPLTTIPDS
jgi:ribosomal protein S18 acetylase RimI-like enzyme